MKSSQGHQIIKVLGKSSEQKLDALTIEEPLQISVSSPSIKNSSGEKQIAVTMRTPGDDKELAAGFLYSEGILTVDDEVIEVVLKNNKINLHLSELSTDLSKLQRNFYTTSSCGVCGKSSIEAIGIAGDIPTPTRTLQITSELLLTLPNIASKRQKLFHKTGGIHAATLFSISGEVVSQYEDVGRHNALDKVVGAGFLNGALPFDGHVLLLSGRASFELLQKAIMAGIQIVVAIGAPSSLAVELAEEYDVTLVGFLKNNSYNIYTAEYRIIRA